MTRNSQRFGNHTIDLATLVVPWTRQVIDVLGAKEISALGRSGKCVVVVNFHSCTVMLL